MKKVLFLLLCIAPLLCGCGGIYAEHREVEQLRVVQTMGLDLAPGGYRLSLAASSGIGANGGSLCYSAGGASVSDAMERLRDSSLEGDLFSGHLQHILLGESLTRQGIEGILAYICRSSDVRLDMPLYLVLGGSAEQAITETGSKEKGIAEALTAMEKKQGKGSLSTAGAILRDLERQGSTLVRCLKLENAAEESEEEGAAVQTVVDQGFGVLVDGKLCRQIDPEDAPAVALLTDSLQPCSLVIAGEQGQTVTVELQEGSARLQPVWGESGSLKGLDIAVTVRASVLEIDGFDPVADPGRADALTARLETAISQRLGNVLRLSRQLEADFLGLGKRIEQLAPRRGRGLDRGFGQLLPDLELSISVQGELIHSNDIN